MKKSACMMLWIASLTGVSGIAAAQINSMPLMACNNALPQPYTTTTSDSTLIFVVNIEFFFNDDCSNSIFTNTYFGQVGLNPSNSFNYCSGIGDNPATRTCQNNIGTQSRSFRIVSLSANGTGFVTQNGSCIRVNCNNEVFQFWSVQSAVTLDL
jgi:hypothetical protein